MHNRKASRETDRTRQDNHIRNGKHEDDEFKTSLGNQSVKQDHHNHNCMTGQTQDDRN